MKGIILTALLLPSLVIAQQTETRNISDFDEIVITSAATVEVKIAEQYEVVVESLDGDLVNLITRLDGDALVIDQSEGGDYLIRLSLPELETLALIGAGDVSVGDADGEDFELAVASSGSITTGNLNFEDIEISVTGSGDLSIGGLEAEQAEISLIGSGDVEIEAMQVEEVEVRLVGAGDISAAGEVEELELQITGAGDFDGSGLNVGLLEGNIVGAGDASFLLVADNRLTQGDFDLGELFNVVGAIEDGSRGDFDGFGDRGDFFGRPGRDMGQVIGLFAVILVLGGPILVVALILRHSYKRKEMLHETLRQYASSDAQVAPEVLDKLLQGSPKNNLKSGVMYLATGLGIATFLLLVGGEEVAAIGCIPGFIGLAKLAIWKLEQQDSEETG